MLKKQTKSKISDIFNAEFEDAYHSNNESFDVIIPIFNTNALFSKNLNSIYKQIPINRLLIGDAGCTDNSIEVLKDYPRVEIYDHSHFKTQGICIADLIKKVKTKHFFYLHADIFLENQDCVFELTKRRGQAEWLEGFRSHLTIVETVHDNYYSDERSYSGMQLGLTSALQDAVKEIHDGDLQRNEDIVIAELVKKQGGSFLKVKDSLHIHQIMNKDCSREPIINSIQLNKAVDPEWITKVYSIHIRGIVKHLDPKPFLINQVQTALLELLKVNGLKLYSAEIEELGKSYPKWNKFLFRGLSWKLHLGMPFQSPKLYFRFVKAKIVISLKKPIGK